ncbi:hypothetical protein A5320_04050 [Rheinheimera sp. SA_1]|uniref:DUF3592 domain-containing protein n=1 Tax=Rheinheimera sp. SA_1 TaxID=1827365 RepID=UPI0008011278|nr:DUF3592 domain-containing protein [Rheinheimera sp. SA_1]OBP16577.1 hypothetical protein A5320_04050 [Rheinheimera sp. SA_1]
MSVFSKIYEFLLFLLLLGSGLFLAVHAIYVFSCYSESSDWDKVSSEVVDVNFVKVEDSQGKKDSYERKLSYKYVYKGQEYISKREYFGLVQTFSKPNDDYIPSQNIIVYVDPSEPSKSVVHRFNLFNFLGQSLVMFISFGIAYLFRPNWIS